MRRRVFCWGAATLLLVVGCSKKIEVQSDGCWTGTVNGGSVEGCGIRTYSLKGHESCYSFQLERDNTTQGTYLRVEVKHGSGPNPYTNIQADPPPWTVSGCVH